MGEAIIKWGHRNTLESRFCNKLPYLWVLERIYITVNYDLLYLCRFGNCWTAGQTSHRALCVCICLCFIFCRNTRICSNHLQRWVLPVGGHNSLPLGTPIKHLSSSHLKNSATATFTTFFFSTDVSYPQIIRVLSFMPFWGVGHRSDYFVGFNLFFPNAWLLLTVIVIHTFIPQVAFLWLFKSKSLIFWCADLLSFHLAAAGTVSTQHYCKLVSKCVTGSMCSLSALAHFSWAAALVALNFILSHWRTIHFLLELMIGKIFVLWETKGKDVLGLCFKLCLHDVMHCSLVSVQVYWILIHRTSWNCNLLHPMFS